MIRLLVFIFVIILSTPALGHDLRLQNPEVQVYFSPKGGAQEAVVREIGQAQKSIFVQAYSFTSAPIAEALKNAHDRGVKVIVDLDKSQKSERYTGATYLRNAGIAVWIDSKHAIAHNKVIVIDGETTITGSFNFTKSAEEKNAENLIIFKDKLLANIYLENVKLHILHSEEY